jgi:methionyl-tRNA formyltransferase
MRIVMMGTGSFAVPTFVSLASSTHQLVALVTRPAKGVHGKRHEPTNPILQAANERQITVLMPANVNSEQSQADLAALEPDLFVVCDFGQILSRQVLSISRLGGINLHASLLPQYRGAAPINWALYDGRTETGVSVIHMTAALDAGPCLCVRRISIEPDETAMELEVRLAQFGVEPVHEAINQLSCWDGRSPIGSMQDTTQATKAPRLKKTDGLVDWQRTAVQIANQVRAMRPWPGTYTYWSGDRSQPLRLILDKVTAIPAAASTQTVPGCVQVDPDGTLCIATGDGQLRLERIQPAGKRVMTAAEFLRGYRIKAGARLGQ